MIEFRKAQLEDAGRIKVRESDVREIWRTSMSDPNKAIRRAIEASRDAWTALIDGEIICVFGVATLSLINRVGTPWLLGSDLMDKYPRQVLRKSKEYMDAIKNGYSSLVNHVDVENRVSVLYLKWLGFEFEDAKPYGITRKPFMKFKMEGGYV